jgi:hypothetical protein
MSRGVGSDGIKRGTNYNHRALIERRLRADIAAITASYAQAERCAQGTHAETVAEPRRVTYVDGKQVAPGTRYCRYCSTILRNRED